MKSKSTLSILSLAIIFASCTSAYKSGQTPDDVYYSPARPVDEYVRQEKNDKKMYRDDDEAYRDDRYLRMKIRDRRYDGLFDDYYSYNPYYYHYYNGSLIYNSPWSSCNYWNYYHNPYYSRVVTVVPTSPVYNKPRTFDLSVYDPKPSNNNPKISSYSNPSSRSYNESNNNYRNSGKDAGSFLRNVFSGSNSGNSGVSPAPNRSSSSSSSSGSSSGSSTNAPTRKF